MTRRWVWGALALAVLTAAPALAETRFITLGTGSGPIPQARRAQPANVLISGEQTILIDCGDGTAQQLGRAGVPLERVRTVFISHLHFDHTAGLLGVIARRYQMLAPGELTIYGPPGTRVTVEGLVAAMKPFTALANVRARTTAWPEDTVKVVEIADGWTSKIGEVTITAAANTHYATQADGPIKESTYAFRFDTPERSFAYTGDTGPSPAVEHLAKGVDVLFSEIMDPTAAIAQLKASRPEMPDFTLAIVEDHFRKEHLTPAEAGLLASKAGVKALVLTHDALADGALGAARTQIGKTYSGPITFAEDLQQF